MTTDDLRTPARYRKRPVVIEAMRWDGSFDGYIAIAEWAKEYDALNINVREYEGHESDQTHLIVHTLEGGMRAEPGDYIIRGVAGEFYPCKPEIFEATYEAVTDDD